MGRLIYRRALLIKMWESHKNASVASLSKFPTILKHLRQIASFTDRVVETCLAEASEDTVTATWIPKVLQEWLIIEFKCGHGNDASVWWNANKGEVPGMNPSEFSEFQMFTYLL